VADGFMDISEIEVDSGATEMNEDLEGSVFKRLNC
jgi:hypothetical protein